ncbi:hypothetical protein M758_10G009500 [Ceratodon purpureus]|nr:hypothetical protein M758_10G009500 [Ceratodon purpureus]
MDEMHDQGGTPELFLSDCCNDLPLSAVAMPESLELQRLGLEDKVVDSGSPYSARIERMTRLRSLNISSDVEFDTAFSKECWAELDPGCTKPGALTKEILLDPEETDRVFKPVDFALGPMLAEGGQARIFKAYVGRNAAFAVKVFKPEFVHALRSHLPANLFHCSHPAICRVIKGVVLESNSYAIVMEMHLQDLRKAMDVIMEKSRNKGPPFKEPEALFYMLTIAYGMQYLHSMGILHRDLKAANVLVHHPKSADDYQSRDYPPAGLFRCAVADYESSAGVMGTRFWRANELLLFLKNRCSLVRMEFTRKMDVYSYGMTCYEILTGHIPFDAHLRNNFDHVIDGQRPQLPPLLSSGVRGLVSRCWHADPNERPEFTEIVEVLQGMMIKLGFKEEDVKGYHQRKPIPTSEMIEKRLSNISTPSTPRYVTIED